MPAPEFARLPWEKHHSFAHGAQTAYIKFRGKICDLYRFIYCETLTVQSSLVIFSFHTSATSNQPADDTNTDCTSLLRAVTGASAQLIQFSTLQP
jgi:hypothetical protein